MKSTEIKAEAIKASHTQLLNIHATSQYPLPEERGGWERE